MSAKRVPLFDRLPEVYKIRDGEQDPSGQLQAYLALVEDAFGAIDANIEELYHDLFIETCSDWTVPYIGDSLGTTALKGDPRTLRADVADTIALRRRKGTIGSIERLAFDLTGWGVHCVELRENLAWHQHLNHQRPDEGGRPPYGPPGETRFTVVRGGTATLRDPAMLSLRGTPFDPFAYTPDFKAAALAAIRYNLPNLAIFLWRLAAYQVTVSKPVYRTTQAVAGAAGDAPFVARFDINPTGEPVTLFNTGRFDAEVQPPVVSLVDETPGPIPAARLTTNSAAGNPAAYVLVNTYSVTNPPLQDLVIGDVGLQLHLPAAFAAGAPWTFRGANLCAWELGLTPNLKPREIAIDPVIGRVAIGVNSQADGDALGAGMLVSYTYGFSGPVGAHLVSRIDPPKVFNDEPFVVKVVNFHKDPAGLRKALDNLQLSGSPLLIEIEDSMTHELDLAAVLGVVNEAGGPNLALNRSLFIRAVDGQRPVIRLARPLRFRPATVVGATPQQQAITVHLEGVYLTRGPAFPAADALIARAAVSTLEILGATLDPGGFRQLDSTRAPVRAAMALADDYGFPAGPERDAFQQTPAIKLYRTIAGPLLIDRPYTLNLQDTIVDAEDAGFSVAAIVNPVTDWGPPLTASGITSFGRMRVFSATGKGGIWVRRLEVQNNQKGCIKYSYFSGDFDRLPQTFACVSAPGARLAFTSTFFGSPGYAQLALIADARIRDQGPGDDAMGAFGFLQESHKWLNLQIRFREFMPVGVRPLLLPVT